MNDTQPTGLQLAVALLAQIGDDDSDRAIAAVHDLADENAQRVTMQHHAADLAQRVADLEAERDELRAQLTASEASDAESIRMYRATRAKCDELLVALHGVGEALGIPESERSPYSVTCGTLERVNRLAAVEAQEPAMYVLRSTARRPQPSVVTHQRYLSAGISELVDMGLDRLDPLYARPTAALADAERQAVPLTDEQLRTAYFSIDSGPEHGRTGIREERLRAVQSAVLSANGRAVRRG